MIKIEHQELEFKDGNPLTGEPGTIVSAEWLNSIQQFVNSMNEEGFNLVSEAGLTSSELKNNQLLQAIKKLTSIDSVAALRKYEADDSEVVYVRSYYKETPGGGGVFKWKNADESPEDRGIIIASDTSVNGRWHRQPQSLYTTDDFGIIADHTDVNQQVYDALNALPENSTLKIAQGVNWDARGIYNVLKDFQTVIDESGRDWARNTWQNARVVFRRTHDNTGSTNGNTERIVGDYHPALFIDTRPADPATGGRASVVYAYNESTRAQMGINLCEKDNAAWELNSYGARVWGTNLMSIGLQDGKFDGNVSFNSGLSNDSFYFGKPACCKTEDSFVSRKARPANDTGQFIDVWAYGASAVWRDYYFANGKKESYTKSGKKILTSDRGEFSGYLRKVIVNPVSPSPLSLDFTGGFFTNYTAEAGQRFQLPPCEKGLEFEFSVDAPYNVAVRPSNGDSFIGKGPGEEMASTTVGSRLKVTGVDDKTWLFESTGTWN